MKVSTRQPFSKFIISDIGVGFTPRTHPRMSFLYTSANIYFVPINKEAPLGIFRGVDWWLKRVYLFIGGTVANLTQGDDIEALYFRQNIVAGGGLRLWNRKWPLAFRFNYGVVVFKQKNPNPLARRDLVKYAPFFAPSVDLDLKATIDAVINFVKELPGLSSR